MPQRWVQEVREQLCVKQTEFQIPSLQTHVKHRHTRNQRPRDLYFPNQNQNEGQNLWEESSRHQFTLQYIYNNIQHEDLVKKLCTYSMHTMDGNVR